MSEMEPYCQVCVASGPPVVVVKVETRYETVLMRNPAIPDRQVPWLAADYHCPKCHRNATNHVRDDFDPKTWTGPKGCDRCNVQSSYGV